MIMKTIIVMPTLSIISSPRACIQFMFLARYDSAGTENRPVRADGAVGLAIRTVFTSPYIEVSNLWKMDAGLKKCSFEFKNNPLK